MVGQGYPQQPQPKKGKGCWIAAAIVGVLLLVLGAGAVFFCVALMKKGREIAEQGRNAPGAKELETLGCMPGLVLDLQATAGIMGMSDAAASGLPWSEGRYIVSCTASSSEAPTCEEVKDVYLAAVPSPGGRFVTQVTAGRNQGRQVTLCKKLYEASGVFVKDLR